MAAAVDAAAAAAAAISNPANNTTAPATSQQAVTLSSTSLAASSSILTSSLPEVSSSALTSAVLPDATSTPSLVVTTIPPSTSFIVVPSETGVRTIIITSTSNEPTSAAPTTSPTSASSSSVTSGIASLATTSANASTRGGLSSGGKIAVAVVVPVVAVAAILFALLFLFRRRKQRKAEEELRRKELEDYNYNPNKDPLLPVVAGSSSHDGDGEMTQTDGGYRGWGTTSTARKPSTTLSSGAGAIGVARSPSGSDNDPMNNTAPVAGASHNGGVAPVDPSIGELPGHPAYSDDPETVGALGAVPSQDNSKNIRRGPSNASSAYSAAHRSELSGDNAIGGGSTSQPYYPDGLYLDESMHQHGPYGDGTYGGAQPVIRDVPARRNTRIESASVAPAQPSTTGIAQNF